MSAARRRGRHTAGAVASQPESSAPQPPRQESASQSGVDGEYLPQPIDARRSPRANRRRPAVRSEVPNGRVSMWGSIRAEFVKTLGLQSTYWLMALTVAFYPMGAALSIWSVWVTSTMDEKGNQLATPKPISAADLWMSVSGMTSTVALVVGIFGVLAVTSEYSTKSIQATFVANPRRADVIEAKSFVVGVMTFAASLTGLLISWGMLAVISRGWTVTPLADDQWRLPWISLLGAALAATLAAKIALGIGAICRATPGGIFALVGLLMLAPSLLSIISLAASRFAWINTIGAFLPSAAIDTFLRGGYQMSLMLSAGQPDYFMPNWWQSLLILVGWWIVAEGVGTLIVRRADIR